MNNEEFVKWAKDLQKCIDTKKNSPSIDLSDSSVIFGVMSAYKDWKNTNNQKESDELKTYCTLVYNTIQQNYSDYLIWLKTGIEPESSLNVAEIQMGLIKPTEKDLLLLEGLKKKNNNTEGHLTV